MTEAQRLRAELEAAKASLAPTASARSQRGKAVNSATNAKRLRATGRDVVFSVRCRSDMPDAIKKLCASQGVSIAAWFEALVDRELGNVS